MNLLPSAVDMCTAHTERTLLKVEYLPWYERLRPLASSVNIGRAACNDAIELCYYLSNEMRMAAIQDYHTRYGKDYNANYDHFNAQPKPGA